jgi:hypothetical protein
MSFSPRNLLETNSAIETSDFIDLKDFANRCSILKNDIKLSKNNISSLDMNINESEDSLPSVNPSLVMKWQRIFENHSSTDQETLEKLILAEDVSLSSESAKKEAALARRIAKSKLASIEAFKTDASVFSTKFINKSSLYANLPTNTSAIKCSTDKTDILMSTEPVLGDDVILTFSIYPGGKYALLHPAHKQEIEVKASDTLLALTEEIYCVSRRAVDDLLIEPSHGEITKSSSFLFIESIFYDDELDEISHVRPSDIYFEAFKAVGSTSNYANLLVSNPSSVQRASLKSTIWMDLKVRLNTPYLFAHLGGCEHVIVINQVRAVNPAYGSDLVFPNLTQSLRVRRRKCRICEVYAGTKMLINDKLMPENPCIICEKCYEGFHGTDLQWYQDFEVIPYYHEA